MIETLIMKIAFLQSIWQEMIGPLILAEILEKKGHIVRFFMLDRTYLQQLIQFQPHILSLSVYTGNHNQMLQTATKLKSILTPKPIIIMGGPHPTFFPQVIMHPSVDAICRGEGEIYFPQFIEQCQDQLMPLSIPNFWIKHHGNMIQNPMGNLLVNLDEIPILKRHSLYSYYPFFKNAPYKWVFAGRGCPYNCSFCFNAAYRQLYKNKGVYIRRRSVNHLIEELIYLKTNYRVSLFMFGDDIFSLDKKWLFEFSERYNQLVNIPFGCNIHANHIDEDIVLMLKHANCSVVAFGIETGNETQRKIALNKNVSNQDIEFCVRLLKKYRIKFQTYNMLGFPGETLSQSFETVRINQLIKPFYAWCSIATPYPGTQMSAICMNDFNQSLDQQMDAIDETYMSSSMIPSPHSHSIMNLHKFFACIVKFPWIEPLVKRLIHLPPNPLFNFIYIIFYGLHQKIRHNMSWKDAMQLYFTQKLNRHL